MTLKYSEHFLLSDSTYLDQSNNALKLLYSTRSGKLIVLPIKHSASIAQNQIPQLPSLLESLKKAEILIPSQSDELEDILHRNNTATQNSKLLYYVLLPSSFCNMQCSYCGQSHQKGGISDDLETKIITRISNAVHSRQPKGLKICWFGGEPLVGYSRIIHMSKSLIELAQQTKINYRAKIVTNGSLLTLEKIRELYHDCKIDEFHITFDGPPSIHDQRRLLRNGKGNFDQTVRTLQAALQDQSLSNVRFIFRTNIDKENQEYITEYLQLMHDLGFKHKQVGFDLKNVYPWSNDVSNVEIEKKQYAKLETDWMTKILELGLNFGFLQKSVTTTCTAVNPQAEVISSSGNVFSCTEHPLIAQHESNNKIGHVSDNWTEKQRNKGDFDDFYEKIALQKYPCGSCKIFGICGGSCPKHWDEGYIPCPSIKYNLQDRLDIVAIKMGYRIDTNES